MMLVIFGPTVTGKTSFAISLAKSVNGEIISADSRQIFSKLDIGTGKVDPNDKVQKNKGYWIVKGTKIYGFDIREPGQSFSAAEFVTYAKDLVTQIIKRKKIPIVVGGTGFYIKALVGGIGTMGIRPNKKLRTELSSLSVDELFIRLKAIDTNKANSLNESDRKNPRRIIRAIEVAQWTGIAKSSPVSEAILIGLTAPNDYLFKKADFWLEKRLELGLISEVKNLLKSGVKPAWLENLGLEYKWVKRHLVDGRQYQESIDSLKGDIHGLIRRQKTFFNQFNNMILFDVSKQGWEKKALVDVKKLLGRE